MSFFGYKRNTTLPKNLVGFKMCTALIFFWIFAKITTAEILECNTALSFNNPTNCRITSGSVANDEQLRISNAWSNITTLVFNGVNFERVPKNIFVQFPKLTVFYISYNNLSQLSSSDFINGNALKNIFFSSNTLQIVPSKIFESCESIEKIAFIANPITTFQEEAFYGLKFLKYLTLEDLSLKYFNPAIFKDVPLLETLKMENVGLMAVTKDFFTANKKLSSISFRRNSITYIEKGTFEKVSSLDYLDIGNNQIVSFSSENIPRVSITSNLLKNLHIGNKTISLNADNNFISNITCDENLSMELLSISNNSLSRLICIGKMTDLEVLELNDNKIGKLNRNIFTNLSNVTKFLINGNPNMKLRSGMLSSFKKVYKMKIDNFVNGYKSLNTTFPKLISLSLIAKNWNCDRVKKVAFVLNSQKILFDFKELVAHDFVCNLTTFQVNKILY